MSTDVVSHNTDSMRAWSGTMDANSNSYDDLINRLYTLIDQFAGSNDFKGGLSSDFLDKVLNQRQAFLNYSRTFEDCSEIIKSTATKIDSDEAQLRSIIERANPLD